jgi:hypothetical protein
MSITDVELNYMTEPSFLELDRHEFADYRNARFKDWALSLCCWDGMVPVFVIGLTMTFHLLFPGNEVINSLAACFIPIAAFFFRAAMADGQFNRKEQYSWQHLLFFFAIFYLVFVEALVILLLVEAGSIVTIVDFLVLVLLYSLYLLAVGAALFPLRLALNSARPSRN